MQGTFLLGKNRHPWIRCGGQWKQVFLPDLLDGFRIVELFEKLLRRKGAEGIPFGVAMVAQIFRAGIETPIRKQFQPGSRTKVITIKERFSLLPIPELQPSRTARRHQIAPMGGKTDRGNNSQMPLQDAQFSSAPYLLQTNTGIMTPTRQQLPVRTKTYRRH